MSFQQQLSAIDLAIIAVSLVLAIGVGLWAGRNQDKTARGYFLASGRLPWFIIGSAFVSTSVSSEQMVGTVGMAYKNGMGVANWEWFTVPHYLVFIVFLVPMYLRNRITTIPDFLTRRYGPLCGSIYSWLMLFAYVFIFMIAILYGGSLTFQRITGWDYNLIRFGLVALIAIYAIKGGLASVMWTDAVQCLMLVGGGMLLFFLALSKTPGGWETMVQADPQRFHLYHPPGDSVAPFLGILSMVFTVGIFYNAGSQVMVQRIRRPVALGRNDGRRVRRIHQSPAAAGHVLLGIRGLLLDLPPESRQTAGEPGFCVSVCPGTLRSAMGIARNRPGGAAIGHHVGHQHFGQLDGHDLQS